MYSLRDIFALTSSPDRQKIASSEQNSTRTRFSMTTTTALRILEMDHIVLNVGDIERSIRFYTEVLGLKGERLEEFRGGKVGFPSVRINADTLIDLMQMPSSDEPGRQNLNH